MLFPLLEVFAARASEGLQLVARTACGKGLSARQIGSAAAFFALGSVLHSQTLQGGFAPLPSKGRRLSNDQVLVRLAELALFRRIAGIKPDKIGVYLQRVEIGGLFGHALEPEISALHTVRRQAPYGLSRPR